MFPINRPEVIITSVQEKVSEGKIVDEHTQEKIVELLTSLISLTKKLNGKK
jgi:hypothetical protein